MAGGHAQFLEQGDMKEARAQLIEMARSIAGAFPLEEGFSAGSVGAAIRTKEGNVYTGVCINLACGLGFCAEAAAIAEMLKNRETGILSVVAVDSGGNILSPCGRCREMMAQVDRANLDAEVILAGGRVVSLRDLLPENWIETGKNGGRPNEKSIP